jgi:hypothetical protein
MVRFCDDADKPSKWLQQGILLSWGSYEENLHGVRISQCWVPDVGESFLLCMKEGNTSRWIKKKKESRSTNLSASLLARIWFR